MIVPFVAFNHVTERGNIDHFTRGVLKDPVDVRLLFVRPTAGIDKTIDQRVVAGRVHGARDHLGVDRILADATAPLAHVRWLQRPKFEFVLQGDFREIDRNEARGLRFEATRRFLRFWLLRVEWIVVVLR